MQLREPLLPPVPRSFPFGRPADPRTTQRLPAAPAHRPRTTLPFAIPAPLPALPFGPVRPFARPVTVTQPVRLPSAPVLPFVRPASARAPRTARVRGLLILLASTLALGVLLALALHG